MTVILALAAVYGLVVAITRESDDVAVHAAYRRVVKRAHPDKGGSTESAQKLQAAKEAWLNAQKRTTPASPSCACEPTLLRLVIDEL